VDAPAERLRRIELKPFQQAIAAGLPTLMTAHVLYTALDRDRPATLSRRILTDLLRGELGFGGVTITDDLEMNAIVDHGGIDEAAVSALSAGADVLLICHRLDRQAAALEAVRHAITRGAIPSETVAAALKRVADLKSRFLTSTGPTDAAKARHVVGAPAHRVLLERVRTGASSTSRT
jgi:beta-N-acetylhexosaminidase